MSTSTAFPVPGKGRAVTAVAAPAAGTGNWVGAPSAVLDQDAGFVVAYRTRTVEGRGGQTVVARSDDGEHLETVVSIDKTRFDAESVERPVVLRTPQGHWRLYVSCATPGSKHWWIGVLEATDLTGLDHAELRTAFPGDERTGVKDPVIRHNGNRWEAWICCHPLEIPGEEDRMSTAYATSGDGLDWTWHGTALAPRPSGWDARGTRLTVVLPDGRAAYDGRATKQENWFERTGLAEPGERPGSFITRRGEPVSDVRYLEVVPLPDGSYRLYYEARLLDGSRELRTEIVPQSP